MTILGGINNRLENNTLKGWGKEINNPDPLRLILDINGQEFPVNSNLKRNDMAKRFKDEGKYGFEFKIPESILKKIKGNFIVKLIHPQTKSIIQTKEFFYDTFLGGFNSLLEEMTIKGWAKEIYSSNPITVGVEINNWRTTIVANTPRLDLAKRFKDDGKYGFELPLPPKVLNTVKGTFVAKLFDPKTNHVIATRAFYLPTFQAGLDSNFDNKTIQGWVKNLFSSQETTIILEINNNRWKITADLKRSGDSGYGFKFKIPPEVLKTLKKNFSVILRDPYSGSSLVQKSFSCPKTMVGGLNSSFQGKIIKGWAKDLSNTLPQSIILQINGKNFSLFSNKKRSDLARRYNDEGNYGFEFQIPPSIKDKNGKFRVNLLNPKDNSILASDVYFYEKNKSVEKLNFENFLKKSMLNPLFLSPFTENEKRCTAFMEDITQYLLSEVDNSLSIPLCSVILPVYNRENFIDQAIDSVLKQSYSNFELIIIDDGSKDNTIKKINQFQDKRIRLLINKTNLGCSASRNKGIKEAKGEFIFFLDSDNTWDPRYLKAMVGAFKKLPSAQALYCGQYLFNGNSSIPFGVRFGSFNISLLENRNYIDLNCFAIKRTSIFSIGLFREDLKRLVDYELILRAAKKLEIFSIPVILSNYFFGKADNSITETVQLPTLDFPQPLNISYKKDSILPVTAIIPNYETLADLEKCILSLNNQVDEIVIVDNNSSETTQNKIKEFESHKIKVFLNKKNLAFTYAVNQGIKIANPKNDILLVNNDSWYEPGSVQIMRETAYSSKAIGLVVPRQILPPNTETINIHVPYANPNNPSDVNLSLAHNNLLTLPIFSNGREIELDFAPFFSVYIKKEIINSAGLLDAEHGRHYRSDRLYCNVIRHILNKKIIYTPFALVHHKLQQSTKTLKDNERENHNLIFNQNLWSEEEMKELKFTRKFWEMM